MIGHADYLSTEAEYKKVEEEAMTQIMQLALYGATLNAQQKGGNLFEANEETMDLFKIVGFIK